MSSTVLAQIAEGHEATTYQSVQIPAGHRPIELDVVGGTFMPPTPSSAT